MAHNDWRWEFGASLFASVILLLFALYSLMQVATTGVLTLRARGMVTTADGPLAWALSFVLVSLGAWCSYRAYQAWRSGPNNGAR